MNSPLALLIFGPSPQSAYRSAYWATSQAPCLPCVPFARFSSLPASPPTPPTHRLQSTVGRPSLTASHVQHKHRPCSLLLATRRWGSRKLTLRRPAAGASPRTLRSRRSRARSGCAPAPAACVCIGRGVRLCVRACVRGRCAACPHGVCHTHARRAMHGAHTHTHTRAHTRLGDLHRGMQQAQQGGGDALLLPPQHQHGALGEGIVLWRGGWVGTGGRMGLGARGWVGEWGVDGGWMGGSGCHMHGCVSVHHACTPAGVLSLPSAPPPPASTPLLPCGAARAPASALGARGWGSGGCWVGGGRAGSRCCGGWWPGGRGWLSCLSRRRGRLAHALITCAHLPRTPPPPHSARTHLAPRAAGPTALL